MTTMHTIGEAAHLVGRSARTLRRYEQLGFIQTQRIGRWRYYTPDDIEKLKTLAAQNDETIRTAAYLAARRKREAVATG